MSTREVVVLGGARTAIGDYGGSLKDFAPTMLGAIAIKEALARAKVDPASVGHVVMGSVIHGEARDMYLSRVAALDAGLPVGTPCLTVNRLCGSGLQAIVSAAQHIMLGDTDTVVAGGAESMSRAAYFLPTGRWGQRMGDSTIVDAMTAALHDPFGHGHMGVTAENIAAQYGFTREQQDAFAVESHRRAANALDKGFFKEQVVPIEVKSKKGVEQVTRDEHVRPGAKIEDLAKLKAVFKKDGTVTAGNASGINDAGAAIVMMEAGAAAKKGLKARARLVAYAHAGVEPQVMGLGPIPAVKKVFEKSGLKPADMDVIESNEAFAAQAMAVTKDLGLDPAKVNPNGGAVALGHPIGATGAILTVKALYELERTQKRYALVTMCIGGGQGIAAIFERV
ncbi:MAG: acetyl-CoA C-acyltransferase family protein [Betaproteobacteria bacterium]|nr:acetyl-CoA C-acyltransferase family protein [Betaproteobacteria bacterium]MDH4325340.1 acetyl-CoA C-acyltransferase family protein [Betaproteobacteria bacterium]MDH5579345.1 acetyl-CoA C-acyltransferase family protein [Betaproteobacteria bacterium]